MTTVSENMQCLDLIIVTTEFSLCMTMLENVVVQFSSAEVKFPAFTSGTRANTTGHSKPIYGRGASRSHGSYSDSFKV